MKRTNPYLFTRDGQLDVGQMLLVLLTLYVLVVFVLAGLRVLTVDSAAWAFLGSFVSVAFVAWAARDRAALISKATSPGAIAAGIASAIPNFRTDDERGEHTARDYIV
jgi:hypothetical protein